MIIDNTGGTSLKIPEYIKSIYLPTNQGIAAAQNHGIRYATSQDADFICFFDQDSQINDNYISLLLSDWLFAKTTSNKPIATIGPRFIDSRHHFFYKIIRLTSKGIHNKIDVSSIQSPLEVSLIISSGSLISVSALQDIGLMEEAFFIDYVDTEWCLRALAKGYAIFVSGQAVMQHAIGDKIIPLFGFHIPVHSAFRRYFRVRNAFWMFGLSHVPKLLALREIMITQIQQLILASTQKDKKFYLKTWWQGIKDGLAGRPNR